MSGFRDTWRQMRLSNAVLGRTLAGQILLWAGGRLQARGVSLIDRAAQIERAAAEREDYGEPSA